MDDGRAFGGDFPFVGDLPARVAADKEDEVGFANGFVGAGAGVLAAYANGEWMVVGEGFFGVEGGGDWNG